MDFRELQYVLAIAEHHSITRAAQALYISQPTLSKFLIGLEQDLGVKLFRKTGHKYQLTYAGERYVEKAGDILRIKKDLDGELADILQRDVGVLNVAFAPMRYSYMVPGTLPAFEKLYPHVKVNVFDGSSAENDRRLLAGQAEVAFYTRPNAPDPQLDYQPLWAEELLLCTPKGHPLGKLAVPDPAGGLPHLEAACLQNERVLMMLPQQRTRQIVDAYLQQQGIMLDNVMETSNLSAMIRLVAVGYGVSFIFDSHLRHHPARQDIDSYRLGETGLVADFVAATRKGSYLSHYAQAFIGIARDFLADAP